MKRTLVQWRFQVSFQTFFDHFCTPAYDKLTQSMNFFIDSFCLVFHANSNHIFDNILGPKLPYLPLFKVTIEMTKSLNFLFIHFVQFFMQILNVYRDPYHSRLCNSQFCNSRNFKGPQFLKFHAHFCTSRTYFSRSPFFILSRPSLRNWSCRRAWKFPYR